MRSFARNFVAELSIVFKDRGVWLVMAGAVILYAFFYPLPYKNEVIKEIPVVAVDMDDSVLSRTLIRWIDAAEQVKVEYRLRDPEEAVAMVRDGRAGGAVIIPIDFERTLKRGGNAGIGAYADAGYFLIYRQVMTGVASAARTLSAGIEIKRLQAHGVPEKAAFAARGPVSFIPRPLFNPASGYSTYIAPAVFILLLQQTLLIGIGMISGTRYEDAKNGVSGESPGSGSAAVLSARAAAFFILYSIHIMFIYGVAYNVWNFPMEGRFWQVYLFLVPFLLAVIFLGQALSALFRTREGAMQALVFTSMPAVMMSGFSWPMEAMPAWVKAVASILPSTWGIMGSIRISRMGAGLSQVFVEWAWLWGLAAGYCIIAWAAARFGHSPIRKTNEE